MLFCTFTVSSAHTEMLPRLCFSANIEEKNKTKQYNLTLIWMLGFEHLSIQYIQFPLCIKTR